MKPKRSITVLAGAILLAFTMAAIAWWPEERHAPAPPPAGVTFTGDGDSTLRERVSAVIVRLRQRDAARLAEFDVDLTTHRRSPGSEAGARWLIEHFSTPLQGPIRVEIRQDENTALNWLACLSYGQEQQKLLLDFVTYGKKGVWPDPNGGDKYAFPVYPYAELADKNPQPDKAIAGLFCNEGDMLPPAQ